MLAKLNVYLRKTRLLHHPMPFRSLINTTCNKIKDFGLEKIKDAQFLRQMVINSEIDAAVTTRQTSDLLSRSHTFKKWEKEILGLSYFNKNSTINK